ncbi:hypothetical protein D1872_260850 [compost metagenome]
MNQRNQGKRTKVTDRTVNRLAVVSFVSKYMANGQIWKAFLDPLEQHNRRPLVTHVCRASLSSEDILALAIDHNIQLVAIPIFHASASARVSLRAGAGILRHVGKEFVVAAGKHVSYLAFEKRE